jgi:PTS system nitrogen regulatory IIA component
LDIKEKRKMLMQELYTSDRIKVGVEAEDKDEVFEELVDFLINAYGLEDRDAILKALHEREEKMSTGIKKGIALPHGKLSSINEIVGVIGISKKGIDYDALDGEPVYLLFLLVSSEKNAELHLKILKKIAMLLEMPEFYTNILKSEGSDQVYKTIKKYEELLEVQDN